MARLLISGYSLVVVGGGGWVVVVVALQVVTASFGFDRRESMGSCSPGKYHLV